MTGRALRLALIAFAAATLARADVPAHVLAERAKGEQPANETRTAVVLRSGNARTIVGVYEIPGNGSNGAVGTVQPGVGTYDEATGRSIEDRQINLPPDGHFTTATSNVAHDAPSVIYPGDGSIIVAYGAASTYPAYRPPSAWACAAARYCEPFKRADANSSDSADALARAPESLLPSAGLSELSFASLNGATIFAGQQQVATPDGEAGAQGYVSYRGNGRFDTAGGNGLYTIASAPNDDGYVEFAVTRATGAGTIALGLDGAACVFANVPAGDARAAATAFVQYANRMCPAFDRRFEAVDAVYAPIEAHLGGSVVGIAVRSGNSLALPAASSVHLRCTGGISCASASGEDTVYDVRGTGLHRHVLWGGVFRLGNFIYDIFDVQQLVGSWYGAEHNSYALALACFRTQGPNGARWRWTDCGGGHPFTLDPGQPPKDRLYAGSPFLIGAPPGGFPRDMTPFIHDWSMRAQAPVVEREPVISSESPALLRDGTLLIAYGCQTADGHDSICYMRLDREGRTMRAGIVDDPHGGGSMPSVGLVALPSGDVALGALVGMGSRWDCASSGACALIYRFDAQTQTWTRVWSRALGGINDAGFPGTVTATRRGLLFMYRQLQTQTQARMLTFERMLE